MRIGIPIGHMDRHRPRQYSGGAVSYCYGANDVDPYEMYDADWQSTAYAMLTLGNLDQATYQAEINRLAQTGPHPGGQNRVGELAAHVQGWTEAIIALVRQIYALFRYGQHLRTEKLFQFLPFYPSQIYL